MLWFRGEGLMAMVAAGGGYKYWVIFKSDYMIVWNTVASSNKVVTVSEKGSVKRSKDPWKYLE